MLQSGTLTLAILSLFMRSVSGVYTTYLGCAAQPFGNPNAVDPFHFRGEFSEGAGTAPWCAERCLEDYGLPISVASDWNTENWCLCGSAMVDGLDLESQLCEFGTCGYGPDFPVCSVADYSISWRYNAYYSTSLGLPTPPNPNVQFMIFGDKSKKTTDVVFGGSLASGDCTAIAEIPFNTYNAIAIPDKDGKPLVCEEDKTSKVCVIYDVATNTWNEGPSLKRGRVGASVTCLDTGVCWIFGGKSREVTEYYDPATGEFALGPDMPVNSAHGVCSALAPSGLIYMVARREPGMTRAFTFDPVSLAFTELAAIAGVEVRYPACAALKDPNTLGEEEIFIVIGGGPNSSGGTSTVRIFDTASGGWNDSPNDYPHEVYGPMVGLIPGSFIVQGGITPEGEELTDIYAYEPETGTWCKQIRGLNKGRSLAPIVGVEKACPSV